MNEYVCTLHSYEYTNYMVYICYTKCNASDHLIPNQLQTSYIYVCVSLCLYIIVKGYSNRLLHDCFLILRRKKEVCSAASYSVPMANRGCTTYHKCVCVCVSDYMRSYFSRTIIFAQRVVTFHLIR